VKAEASKLPAGRPVALYLRRSTSLQDQSIGSQRDYLTRYAAEHGLEVVREYVDDAVSGTSVDGRMAFQKLIADAQGRADFRAVLTYDVKRFSRGDVDEVGHFRYLLRQKGIDIIYAVEDFRDDFAGDILRPIKQVMARQESVELSRVTLRGHLKSITDGWYIGGVPAYGYDYQVIDSAGRSFQVLRTMPDGSKQVLSVDGKLQRLIPQGEKLTVSRKDRLKLVPSLPERVEAVRSIFRLYVQEGLGYRAIASRLNQRGVPSPRCGRWGATRYDGHWGAATIRNVLLNATYIGSTLWNRRASGKFHRVADGLPVPRERRLSGIAKANDPSDWIVIPDTHEPLIEASLFDAVQRLRRQRDETGHHLRVPLGRGRYSNYLLSGRIVCSRCGHKFQGYSQKIRRGERPQPHDRPQSYLCGGYVTKGRAVCQRHAIDKSAFEAFVLDCVHSRLVEVLDGGGMNLLRSYVQEELIAAVSHPKAELARVEKDLGQLKADTDRLLDSLTPTNKEFIDERLVQTKRRRRELESRQETLRRAACRDLDIHAATRDALAYLGRFRDVVASGTFFEQKEFIGSFVESIELDAAEKKGMIRMRDPAAASLAINGWNRPKLYRRMSRFRIPRDFGRP
jgi:DNA invertase Pin-like site-specific DNA recombinase